MVIQFLLFVFDCFVYIRIIISILMMMTVIVGISIMISSLIVA